MRIIRKTTLAKVLVVVCTIWVTCLLLIFVDNQPKEWHESLVPIAAPLAVGRIEGNDVYVYGRAYGQNRRSKNDEHDNGKNSIRNDEDFRVYNVHVAKSKSKSKSKSKPFLSSTHAAAAANLFDSNSWQRPQSSQAVIAVPKVSYGEMGKPVNLPTNLSQDVDFLIKDGWEKNAFNQYVSDLISVNRTLLDPRDDWCKKPNKYLENLPKTSVIVCFHNEAWSVLLRTVHSIINRSPAHLLQEIILVDDNSTMEHLKDNLTNYMAQFEQVKIVRADRREGLIRARLLGAKHANAPVITFLDSHCECTVGWLEPLLDRIARNRTTVVCPVIDVIDDTTLEYHWHDSSVVNVGGFDWNLQFNWHQVPEHERKKHENPAEPVWSPTMAGGLFSIDKAFFEELGSYDDGFDIWGGENLELSFKTWMCGGTLEIVPCSHVGHIFRKRSPYKWRSGVNVLKRNSIRLAEVWLDEYKKYYYQRIGGDLGQFGDVSSRIALRKSLNCKPFKWFLDHIYPELFIPGDAVASGEIASLPLNICLDSACRQEDLHKPLGLWPCHKQGGNQYWMFSKTGEIRRDESCLDFDGTNVILYPCHGSKGNQFWSYDVEKKTLYHNSSKRYLTISVDGTKLLMDFLRENSTYQKWIIENYDSSKL